MTTDRELLDTLAHLVDDLDPTPRTLAAQAQCALNERTDAATMRLVADSVRTAPPGMRGRGGTRTLTFTDLDLRLDHVRGGLHATGLARAGTLAVVRWPGGQVTAAIDPAGWFHVERVPFGPVRFVLRGTGRDHATPWFVA
ncbi:hypothetical protein ALI22I_40805 [Saccharothrix sp. ALI-22-I]|uniref:hypothetical protein n=1 Tax=Saccharothrix sp. ALI-22-I TaxID=1933778 RepID=UPI00097C1982|nr:hypothetical protein [Saccharothrix sp. ALI-22-I]ONI82431.1 hypothetical protein ALI22I_40805 [Saccharothrix sp. ALI-22-I]